ncbi:unnamed protein product, partial [Musa acuminata subsp. burmannicoides]
GDKGLLCLLLFLLCVLWFQKQKFQRQAWNHVVFDNIACFFVSLNRSKIYIYTSCLHTRHDP